MKILSPLLFLFFSFAYGQKSKITIEHIEDSTSSEHQFFYENQKIVHSIDRFGKNTWFTLTNNSIYTVVDSASDNSISSKKQYYLNNELDTVWMIAFYYGDINYTETRLKKGDTTVINRIFPMGLKYSGWYEIEKLFNVGDSNYYRRYSLDELGYEYLNAERKEFQEIKGDTVIVYSMGRNSLNEPYELVSTTKSVFKNGLKIWESDLWFYFIYDNQVEDITIKKYTYNKDNNISKIHYSQTNSDQRSWVERYSYSDW